MFPLRTALCAAMLAMPAVTAPGSQAPFQLVSVSVQPNDVWKLNREIVFLFNDPLDLTTVNTNTIQLRDEGGVPVLGDFTLAAPRELVFQPACPTQTDLSDSGFRPGMSYSLLVPAGGTTGVLYSRLGDPLSTGAQLSFTTPNTIVLADLFDDGGGGPATVLIQPGDADGSFVETGDGDRQYFQSLAPQLAALLDYAPPLNLISDAKSRVTVHVRLDQPIANFPWNLTMDQARLEYEDASQGWLPLSTEIELLQNCGGGHSTLLLTANGVLPQGCVVRAVLTNELQDLIGQQTLGDNDSLRFRTSKAEDRFGFRLDVVDEWKESFHVAAGQEGSVEDAEAALDYPSADWGDGKLSASVNFEGDGGPAGTFDFHVAQGTTMVFSTTNQVIVGGPGGLPTHQVNVVNGVLNVRDLYVPDDTNLIFKGPNGVKILATGNVRIDGKISVDGNNAASVFTLNTPNQPELGAKGNCGGGDGGVGSFLTTEVTPFGGSGFGAFNTVSGGGQGGESGWSSDNSSNGIKRRAAGGGGGRFGADQYILWDETNCAEEDSIGLNAESGFPGSPDAMSSQAAGTHFPHGGKAGPSPFQVSDVRDNFFGRARVNLGTPNEHVVVGELAHAWAGSGGGAGGDATYVPIGGSYPPPTLVYSHQDKGAGGGGGAGSIEIYCLGDVTFGADGKLTARGGHGNGGENTAGVNRIGGGSGGGSGGHIIVHAGGKIDLSMVPPGTYAIDAKGGQGGDGASGSGGAFVGESTPQADARHIGANFGHDNPWEIGMLACQRYWNNLFSGTPTGVVVSAGGDGGPGVVQLHVNSLSGQDITHDVVYPGAGTQNELSAVVRPVPVGFDRIRGEWRDQLLLAFGSKSQAQSKWIAIGVPQAAPNTTTPDLLRFSFEGTDPATGLVSATGGIVDSLPALLSPSNLPESPGLPNLSGSDGIHFDPTALPAHYAANPSALVGFVVERAGWLRSVETAEIRFDGTQNVLSLTLDGAWPSPPVGGPVTLQPRYFRVAGALDANPVPNELPAGLSARLEFQAAPATDEGQVDAARAIPGESAWATDVSLLTNSPMNDELRFVRFRVTFDLQSQGGGALATSSLYMDLLKLPFLF